MTALLQFDCRNLLLRKLAPSDYAGLATSLVRLDSGQRDSFGQPGVANEYVYFPETGIASVTSLRDPLRLEIGMVGREGFVGLPVLLSDGVPTASTSVQVPGTFLRIPAPVFRSVAFASPAMLGLLLRYVQAYIVQLTSTAVANGANNVEQRLARWLLMAWDRTARDEIPLTHDLIAMMLGVRRPGVTVATHVLEGEHAIRAMRGRIKVLDRAKLRTMAADSYGAAEAEYERLIGVPISGDER